MLVKAVSGITNVNHTVIKNANTRFSYFPTPFNYSKVVMYYDHTPHWRNIVSISCNMASHILLTLVITGKARRLSFSGCFHRDYFVYAPNQWETAFQCNVVFHWLHGRKHITIPAFKYIFVCQTPFLKMADIYQHSEHKCLQGHPE